jgi:hypothetical protein
MIAQLRNQTALFNIDASFRWRIWWDVRISLALNLIRSSKSITRRLLLIWLNLVDYLLIANFILFMHFFVVLREWLNLWWRNFVLLCYTVGALIRRFVWWTIWKVIVMKESVFLWCKLDKPKQSDLQSSFIAIKCSQLSDQLGHVFLISIFPNHILYYSFQKIS